jgi:phosphate transport system protein
MTEHTLTAFDSELAELRSLIEGMGTAVLLQVWAASAALQQSDAGLVEQVIQKDHTVESLFREIDEKVIRMVAKRQPMARDLREIMVAIKILSDLERIGDLAENTAMRYVALAEVNSRLVDVLIPIGEMAERGLRQVLQVFHVNDTKAALAVWECDVTHDEFYNSSFCLLLTYMLENPRNIAACTHLAFVAKNMECIGDHATNIAENIFYLVEGKAPAGPRPKRDTTAL